MTAMPWLDRRPILIALAGPNGAGKSTFYHAHLKRAGLRFVNTDDIARRLGLDAYAAARIADAVRRQLVAERESFIFETVFSDPVGDKLAFLRDAAAAGYTVALCYIGLSSAAVSQSRVAMRVSQGGHDVPDDKLKARYPRTLTNLRGAIRELPYVLVYDNTDLGTPFQHVATFEAGAATRLNKPLPKWLRDAMP